MSLTLLAGFSAIGGILAGYFTARLAPLWALLVLWAGSLLGSAVFYGLVMTFPIMDAFVAVIILMGVLLPFTLSLFLAGALGLLVRRVSGEEPAP